MKLERLFPALGWLRDYRRSDLTSDLLAGVIVTIMLIPQSLAYALLAGLPPQVGLYASILPLVAYAAFGSSRTLAVGPVAVVSLMTAASVSKVAAPGSPEYLAAALALALLSGLFLLALGLARLGAIANLLSHPVISGFISASAVLIAISQMKHILGVPVVGHSLAEILPSLAGNLGRLNLPTLAIGGAAIAFLFWVRGRLKPLLTRAGLGPRLADFVAKAGPVAAVVVGILAVRLLGLEAAGVAVVGEIPRGLPPLTVPAIDAELWLDLLPAAALISLVGFVETVSVAETLAAKRRQRIDANQELVGLGAANLAAAVTGGYPVTGGFARSVVNFAAGAQTPLAGVVTAVLIAVTAAFLTPLFFFLPQAVLAATIVVAVLSLVDLGAIRRTWRYSKGDFTAMAATIVVVLGVGVEAGILAGILLSIALFLWRTTRPHIAVVGQVPGSEHFRNVERHKVVESETVLTIRVDESLYFANSRFLEERILQLVAARPKVAHVVLMCPAVNFIDASALESLEAIADRLETAGVTLHLSEVKGPVMDRLQHSDFFEHLTGEVFLSQHAALRTLDPEASERARSSAPAALQLASGDG
ncbi:MAG: sulfate permease [Tistlia sp.]|uniref:SulP family inorganic anion transporter n=1 Tax=Tistlia sp. TaxID=3057121 RepID=UPI0034A28109